MSAKHCNFVDLRRIRDTFRCYHHGFLLPTCRIRTCDVNEYFRTYLYHLTNIYHPILSHRFQRSLDPAQMKLGINETCERIKEEFNFIQSQYHSLKMECEKLAQEKTEMQRHYVMVSFDELCQSMKPATL